ncbi:MAG: (2Fe-2S)-binding protein [Comamonadaceae bacterium]|nr:MAG: (2Fe-2S)-binding protein [Comamonadaceae bacterium]
MPQPSIPATTLRADQAVRRGPPLQFTLDGDTVSAFGGESVAAALFASGRRSLRRSPRDDQPRGAFCLMGSCQECLVWIGARKLPACQVPVTDGLEVETLPHREARHG